MPAAAKTDDGRAPTNGTNRPVPAAGWVGVGLAVVAGVLARVLAESPLWLDEALSVNIAGLPLGEIDDALRSDGHPPLYYWLLHGWMAVFGDGDAATRSLSVVLGIAALPLAWLVGRRAGGPVVGAWSVVLLAMAPYAARYGSEARMYSLVMLLVLVGAVLLPAALDEPRPARLAGLAAVAAALVYTQYWAVYLLAGAGAVLLWRVRSRPEVRRAPLLALAALAAGAATFLAWLPVFVDQARHTGTPWARPARPAQILMDTLRDLGTGGTDVFAEGELLGVALAVLLFVGILGHRRAGEGTTTLEPTPAPGVRELAMVAFVTMLVGATVGWLSGSAFNARYAAVVVPLLLVLAAIGLVRLPRRWPATGAAVVVVALSAAGLVKATTTDRTEAEDVAAHVVAGEGAGDVVVACPDQLGVSLHRALAQAGSSVEVLPYPDLGDPRFVRWRDYAERNDAADPAAVAAEVDGQATGAVWLAWNGSYRTFEGDCEALINALGSARGAPTQIGDVPDERAFEHADLLRFEAGAP